MEEAVKVEVGVRRGGGGGARCSAAPWPREYRRRTHQPRPRRGYGRGWHASASRSVRPCGRRRGMRRRRRWARGPTMVRGAPRHQQGRGRGRRSSREWRCRWRGGGAPGEGSHSECSHSKCSHSKCSQGKEEEEEEEAHRRRGEAHLLLLEVHLAAISHLAARGRPARQLRRREEGREAQPQPHVLRRWCAAHATPAQPQGRQRRRS